MLGLSHNNSLLLYALLAILGLVLLVARFKVNSFVALILASVFVGVCSGMDLLEIVRHFQEGLGSVLSSIAMVIGLGTILGKMLAESGAAEAVADALRRALGDQRMAWTMMLLGFIVGIPVFFGVGIVLLVPVLYAVVRETKLPLLFLGLPLVAALSIVHGLVPPHPGPMAAIGILSADTGKTVIYSILVAFPTAILTGPLIGVRLAKSVTVDATGLSPATAKIKKPDRVPPLGRTLISILLPVFLMMLATIADLTLARANPLRQWLDFIGSPLIAMLLAVLLSFYTFGFACGFSRSDILRFTEECLGPVATILLVVGAGGGFSRVLVGGGVANAIAEWVQGAHISPLVLGWAVAALIRVAVGSATVAITTASGIVAPIASGPAGVSLEWLVIAMGAGSSFLSHVNDGGFWFVKEYFNLTVPQTLRTWTVVVTLNSILALPFVLIFSRLLP